MTPQDLLNRIALHSAGKWTQRGYVLFGWLFRLSRGSQGEIFSVVQADAGVHNRGPYVMIAIESPADWQDQLLRFAAAHSIPFIRQVL